MNKANSDSALLSVILDGDLREPLHVQLTQQIRQLILTGRLNPSDRIASSRMLAEELSVSRVTVTTALDQLISEGYAESRQGSGVYVAGDLPEFSTQIHPATPGKSEIDPVDSAEPPMRRIRPFEVSVPDLRKFPYAEWTRVFDRVWREPEEELLSMPDSFGLRSLRRAIARHLYEWRGIDCSASQIVITSGIVESIELIAREFLNAGDTVVMEEPGYNILRQACQMSGLKCRPVMVDQQGLDINHAARLYPDACAVAVTPSRHYPLGMTLPLGRRLNLLDWADQTDSIIIEDDFDSEYRYQGTPLPALMSLDDRQSVIYVGSFSKVIFPAVRLSYFVLPLRLVAAMRDTLSIASTRASLMLQPVLAQFIESGMLATHIRRMRRLYARRQKTLYEALRLSLPEVLEIKTVSAGMHMIAGIKPKLKRRMTETEIVRRAQRVDLVLRPLSGYFTTPDPPQGLVLGFAAFDEEEIQQSVEKLTDILVKS